MYYNMFLIYAVYFIAILNGYSANQDVINVNVIVPQICSTCEETEPSSYSNNLLHTFCEAGKGKLIGRRCCQSTDDDILGIDLSNCSLKILSKMMDGFVNLQFVALNDNPLANISSDDFMGISKLKYMIIPSSLVCPGGPSSWKKAIHNEAEKVLECDTELNDCNTLDVACPENSHCSPFGPGLHQCLCDADYHGYKCMRKGTFPWIQWGAGIGGVTIGIVLALALAQRPSLKRAKLAHAD